MTIAFCAQKQIPIVVGTTAWLDALPQVTEWVNNANSALLYASNFSVGVNLFFELNRHLAQLMNAHPSYQIAVSETHHVQKLDAPSGTAISLAKGVIENSNYKNWTMENPKSDDILIEAKQFKIKNRTELYFSQADVKTADLYKDLHKITFEFFKDEKFGLIFTLGYVLAMLAMAFHLWHGFQSAFQSLGATGSKLTPAIKLFGKLFSVIVPLLFAIIPIYIHFSK